MQREILKAATMDGRFQITTLICHLVSRYPSRLNNTLHTKMLFSRRFGIFKNVQWLKFQQIGFNRGETFLPGPFKRHIIIWHEH